MCGEEVRGIRVTIHSASEMLHAGKVDIRRDLAWQSAIKLVFVRNTLQLLLQDGSSAYMDACNT
jgi:hypothetical protein